MARPVGTGGIAPALTKVEIQRLLAVAGVQRQGLMYQALIQVCLSSARVGEATFLRRGQVEAEDGKIFPVIVLKPTENKSKTNGCIYLTSSAQTALVAYLASIPNLGPDQLIFPLNPNYASQLVSSLFKKAGFAPVYSSHSLRRTALQALAKQLPIWKVQQAARHKNIQTTISYMNRETKDIMDIASKLSY